MFERSRTAAVATAAALTLSLGLTGAAIAHSGPHHVQSQPHAVPAPPAHPTNANQIQNLDQVRTAIKAYYGDTPPTTPDPVDGSTLLHTFAVHGAYAKQMHRIEARAKAFLKRARHHHVRTHHHTRAIVLDVDDTTLNTYNYEIYSNFVYNPTSNAAFVNAAAFPAVPGMPRLVNFAKAKGYDVFFLTGRPGTQLAGTQTNLAKAGYPAVANDHVYLKDYAADTWLAGCAPSCTTIQYKSLTRKHIQSLGYDIVANFGDQFSDLKGGHADRTFKLPNPMYYLP
jgi:hypothetical protein